MIACRYRAWLDDGDPAVIAPELEALLPKMHACAKRLLGNAADADDAVQEALLTLLAGREGLSADVPLGAVGLRLVGERALMLARSRARRWRRQRPLAMADDHCQTPADRALPSNWEERLAALPSAARQLLDALAEGESLPALASRYGWSVNRLRVLLHRTRKRLKSGHVLVKLIPDSGV